MHHLIRTYTTAYFAYLDRLMPLIQRFSKDPSIELRQLSICVLDDVIEFCGDEGWNYAPYFGEVLYTALSDDAAEVHSPLKCLLE